MTIEEMQHKLLSLVDDIMKLKKELEVYKKALEIVVTEQEFRECVVQTARGWVESELQKAREQNNDT